MVFIDLEKTYDEVPREVLWRCLEVRSVSVAYSRVIQNMYNSQAGKNTGRRLRTLLSHNGVAPEIRSKPVSICVVGVG